MVYFLLQLIIMKRIIIIIILLAIGINLFNIAKVTAEGINPLPETGAVSGFIGNAQNYALSCESRSAADMAAFWNVALGEKEILNSLPSSDDPQLGFVGDVNGKWGNIPPGDYGVHAQPISAVLRQNGLDAEARIGMSFEELKAEIAYGRPSIVWVIGNVWHGIPQQYITSAGQQVTVASFEHSMVITGYNAQQVTLVNSGNGKTADYLIEDFLASWSVLNNMAVIVKGKLGENTPEMGTATLLPITPVPLITIDPSTSTPAITPTAIQPITWQYTVERGDTLSFLAEKWNIPFQDLANYNQLTPPYTLFKGQVLFVPNNSDISATP